MALIIRKPGILTTVQDLGRFGARSFGVNPNGVMDITATRIINLILGNDESSGVLEMHFPAPEIEFDDRTVFAIGGADFGGTLDERPVSNWKTSEAEAGSVLKFSKRSTGNRAYLALNGGTKLTTWLGSSSTNMTAAAGGFEGRRLLAGDRIECGDDAVSYRSLLAGISIIPPYLSSPVVRILAGSEYEYLTAESEEILLQDKFSLTNDCNRMGYRLSGKPLQLVEKRVMVSAAVGFGTIQLLPDGQMIILMADHQTSGGYARIANVISVDLPLLAQCGPGDSVRFETVSIEEAENAALQFERELNFLRVGCRLQTQC